MIKSLTSKQQRTLVVAVLLAMIVLGFSVTVLPVWMANTSRQESIQLLQDRLARLLRMAEADISLRPRLEQLKRAELNNNHYLKGTTDTVAAAELQRLVKTITGRNQVNVTSTQILPTVTESNFVRIGLKVRVRGAMRGLVESIYEIESDSTFLFLDKLVLRDGSRRRSASATAAKPIDAEFELSAYAYMPDDE